MPIKPFRSARATFARRLPIAPWSSHLEGQLLALEVRLLRVQAMALLAQAQVLLAVQRLVAPSQVEPLLAPCLRQEQLERQLPRHRLLQCYFHSLLLPIRRSHLPPLQNEGC